MKRRRKRRSDSWQKSGDADGNDGLRSAYRKVGIRPRERERSIREREDSIRGREGYYFVLVLLVKLIIQFVRFKLSTEGFCTFSSSVFRTLMQKIALLAIERKKIIFLLGPKQKQQEYKYQVEMNSGMSVHNSELCTTDETGCETRSRTPILKCLKASKQNSGKRMFTVYERTLFSHQRTRIHKQILAKSVKTLCGKWRKMKKRTAELFVQTERTLVLAVAS